MPSGRNNAITLSFAKKNQDVLELLIKKKQHNSFIQSDYICDAIRFYEKNKTKTFDESINADEIRKLVDERFYELKKELLNSTESLICIEAKKDTFNNKVLEDDIDSFNLAALEED